MRVIKVSEASGAVLDWLVAKCEGEGIRVEGGKVRFALSQFMPDYDLYSPSTDWGQGGPIKEREGIATRRSKGKWYAMLSSDLGDGERAQWCKFTFIGVPKGASTSRRCLFDGETELQAAMRCYVASKLGDTAEVPDELA